MDAGISIIFPSKMDHEKPEVMVGPSAHNSSQPIAQPIMQPIVQPDVELVEFDEHIHDGVTRVATKAKREARGDSLW